MKPFKSLTLVIPVLVQVVTAQLLRHPENCVISIANFTISDGFVQRHLQYLNYNRNPHVINLLPVVPTITNMTKHYHGHNTDRRNYSSRFGYRGGCLQFVLIEPTIAQIQSFSFHSGYGFSSLGIFFTLYTDRVYAHIDLGAPYDLNTKINYLSARIIFIINFASNFSGDNDDATLMYWGMFCYICPKRVTLQSLKSNHIWNSVEIEGLYRRLHIVDPPKLIGRSNLKFRERWEMEKQMCSIPIYFLENEMCWLLQAIMALFAPRFNLSSSMPGSYLSTFDLRSYSNGLHKWTYTMPGHAMKVHLYYCRGAPSWSARALDILVNTFDLYTALCVILSGILLAAVMRKYVYLLYFLNILLRQATPDPCPVTVIILSYALWVINIYYEGFMSGIIIEPIQESRIWSYEELFRNGYHLQHGRPVTFHLSFPLLKKGLNLTEFIVEKDCYTPNSTNLAHAVANCAFFVYSFNIDSSLTQIKANRKNLTCYVIDEVLYHVQMYWNSVGHASDLLYSYFQRIWSSGLHQLFDSLNQFRNDRKLRWLPTPKLSKLSFSSNIFIAFELYAILIGVALLQFTAELIMQNVNRKSTSSVNHFSGEKI